MADDRPGADRQRDATPQRHDPRPEERELALKREEPRRVHEEAAALEGKREVLRAVLEGLLIDRLRHLGRVLLRLDEVVPGPYRMLLCEDEPCVAEFCKRVIEGEGLNVSIVHVADGDEALELLQGERFDLLIADEYHPGARGCDLCRASKSRHRSMPILLCTACCESEVTRWGGDFPLWDGFLRKPFTPRELIWWIRCLPDWPA